MKWISPPKSSKQLNSQKNVVSDNDELNRMHYLEISTGDIYNMNGGLCCGCLSSVRDIRGIAANDNYVAVTGGFCKAGRDGNKKIN